MAEDLEESMDSEDVNLEDIRRKLRRYDTLYNLGKVLAEAGFISAALLIRHLFDGFDPIEQYAVLGQVVAITGGACLAGAFGEKYNKLQDEYSAMLNEMYEDEQTKSEV